MGKVGHSRPARSGCRTRGEKSPRALQVGFAQETLRLLVHSASASIMVGHEMLRTLVCLGLVLVCAPATYAAAIQNDQLSIQIPCGQRCLWQLGDHRFAPPPFSIDGKAISEYAPLLSPSKAPEHLANGVTEYFFAGALAADPHLHLQIEFQ